MTSTPRRSIYSLSFAELQQWLKQVGEPAFRATQVFEWAYHRAAASFEQMTNLSLALRARLSAAFSIGPLEELETASNDEARKSLVRFYDGAQVECVAIRTDGAPTFCLSSQVGCSLGCIVCASTIGGLERSLSVAEILAQVVTLQAATERPGNVVFMGTGEPLLNFQNVVEAISRLTDRRAWGLSPSRITVSTAGIVPGIHKLAELRLGVELAVSLGGASDKQRLGLMPVTARWPLEQLMEACKHYTQAHRGQPVTFAYVVIEGVNDSLDDARALGKLLRPLRHHLNLIPLNPTEHCSLRPPSRDRLHSLLVECRKHGLNVSVRNSKGGALQAACGQLRHRRSR